MNLDKSRLTRTLDYQVVVGRKANNSNVSDSHRGIDTEIVGSRDELAAKTSFDSFVNTYKDEIDLLIKSSVSKQLDELRRQDERKLASELKKEKEKIDVELEGELKKLRSKGEALEELISELTRHKFESLKKELFDLEVILVQISMEVLYKMLGDNKFYQNAMVELVSNLTKKSASKINVSIKVSESTYYFLASIYKNDDVMNKVSKDSSLSEGQIVVDDGTSITAVGILDQLETLKSAFIAQLRENHEL